MSAKNDRSPDATGGTSSSEGLKVLVVEDEFFVACSLEEDLRASGYAVIGPFADLAGALRAVRREAFDLAIIDVNLNGEMVYPLADELTACGIPFLFLSGYGAASMPERYRTLPRIAKPYNPAMLSREIQRILPQSG